MHEIGEHEKGKVEKSSDGEDDDERNLGRFCGRRHEMKVV